MITKSVTQTKFLTWLLTWHQLTLKKLFLYILKPLRVTEAVFLFFNFSFSYLYVKTKIPFLSYSFIYSGIFIQKTSEVSRVKFDVKMKRRLRRTFQNSSMVNLENFWIFDLIGPDRCRSESEIFQKPIHVVYHSKALPEINIKQKTV